MKSTLFSLIVLMAIVSCNSRAPGSEDDADGPDDSIPLVPMCQPACGPHEECNDQGRCVPMQGSASCIDARLCPAGQLCGPDECQVGAPGEACSVHEHCRYGCASDSTCNAGQLGDRCSTSGDCERRNCSNGQCAASANETCSDLPCTTPWLCGPDKICRAGAAGDACGAKEQCKTGLVCGPRSLCQAGAAGDACNADSDCTNGLRCGPENQCQQGAVGDKCGEAADCTARCGPKGLCQRGDQAELCANDTQCAEGLRCSSASTCTIFAFNPLNVGASVHRRALPEAAMNCKNTRMNSDTGEVQCNGGPVYLDPFTVKQSSSIAPSAMVFMVKSLTVPAGGLWTITGTRPAIVLAADYVQIDGDVRVLPSSRAAEYIPYGMRCPTDRVTGTPLVGGGDGTSGTAEQSDGGGALQISAAVRIEVGLLGTITASGENAAYSSVGGGFGGTVVLEAPNLTINGSVTAHGGTAPQPAKPGNIGVVRLHSAAGHAAGKFSLDECAAEGTLQAYSPAAPLQCASVPSTSTSCDLCKAEQCCAVNDMCTQDAVCKACLMTSTGAACTNSTVFTSYKTCLKDFCGSCVL